ncbi:MAG: carbohydrate binding family 9 domain-containing protein, partial [Cyclobacteriaceae bacterium]|nr:carbohydrate binding family 9 domain-containing protein [Cyclobacteriaceae bacterium]
MCRKFWLIAILLFFSSNVFPQKINADYTIQIREVEDPIVIDGELNEATWSNVDVAGDFFMVLPMDTSHAQVRTDVMMAYDADAFYLVAVCYDDLPGGYIVESLRRDFSFGGNDNFLVFIDPFDDQTNGFSFGANAAGAQWDGMMHSGHSVNLNWDNKWSSKVKNYEDKWIFECRIPFKTMRYKKGIKQWGINFSRLDLKLNEKSSWTPVPRQFPTASLAYTGILQWDKTPPNPGTNISLIPYGMTNYTKDHQNDGKEDVNWDIGIDAKIAITSSMSLDLTVNPDFSQVEVDRQVTNLSRFELFFPERRQFFLENSDLFANLGTMGARPFFSRRIGLESPIHAGARVSGRINKDWRIGVMDIQTGEADEVYNSEDELERGAIPNQNYAVAVLQRQVFARSNITASFINRELFNLDYTTHDSSFTNYNRDLGLEYNLYSSDNLWSGKFLLHISFSPDLSGDDLFHSANLEYDSKKFAVQWAHEYVGENYNAEVGFIRRTGYYRISPDLRYTFFTKNSERLISHGPKLDVSYMWDRNFEKTDSDIDFVYAFEMLNRSSFGFGISRNYVRLIDPFDPTNSGGEELPAGSEYDTWGGGFGFNSTPKRMFTYDFKGSYGGYFNGNLLHFDGGAGYRFQPYGSI